MHKNTSDSYSKANSSSSDDVEEFVKLTEQAVPQALPQAGSRYPVGMIPGSTGDESDKKEPKPGAAVQYAVHGGGYRPTTSTVKSLPPGCYNILADQNGSYVVPSTPPIGLLLALPEMRSEHVLSLVQTFWDSEKDYKEGNEFVHGGAAYKAGILLFGPPGSGKTSVIKLLSKTLVERGGTVFNAETHPMLVSAFLQDFSRIEPDRKMIVILEDLDSLIDQNGEAGYLSLLDSGQSIDNTLFLATSNYPERLDQRVYNRPGRLSHVVRIGLPTALAREAFLKAILKNWRDVAEIVILTEGFSVDHLSSLCNAVYREKKDLNEEIKRLRTLFRVPKSTEAGPLGIGGT